MYKINYVNTRNENVVENYETKSDAVNRFTTLMNNGSIVYGGISDNSEIENELLENCMNNARERMETMENIVIDNLMNDVLHFY